MAIEVIGLHKRFGSFVALSRVDLHIRPGELVALLGPSGSGKTTLLRIIAGLEVADEGQVRIAGMETGSLATRDRKVGFVFQHYALFKHMTVFDNIAFGLRMVPRATRLPEGDIRERVTSLLELVHLEQFHNRYPHQLSGGQRQRVALARSLAVEPQLLLLDEPFGALDSKVRKELRRWLRRLHDEVKITTLFVTHDQEEAMEVADRVVVMNQGAIEQVGTPEQVWHHPANGFVYDFLGNYNEFAGWRDDEGRVHLAEDDVQVARSRTEAPAQVLSRATQWLRRHPRLARVSEWLAPENVEVELALSKRNDPNDLRLRLSRRGTPVRVFARPHEMYVMREPDQQFDSIPAKVLHINAAGSLCKIEMERESGHVLQVEVPKSIIDNLAIRKNETFYVRPKQMRVFE